MRNGQYRLHKAHHEVVGMTPPPKALEGKIQTACEV